MGGRLKGPGFRDGVIVVRPGTGATRAEPGTLLYRDALLAGLKDMGIVFDYTVLPADLT
ncbi:MAG: hypothetical protein NT080_04270 [Spirochaetes bacterium]|nr:hypothetical protein [Spirochaetota bacterium]